MLTPLNLPTAHFEIKECADGITRIFDSLRQRFVALTPEEWVRQNFVAHLVTSLGFPPALMANEVPIEFNGMSRRCDTVLFSADGLRPRVIVEYKAPSIKITQKVFDQIVRYNSVLRADVLIVSNGLQHYVCRMDYSANTYRFLPSIPPFESLP